MTHTIRKNHKENDNKITISITVTIIVNTPPILQFHRGLLKNNDVWTFLMVHAWSWFMNFFSPGMVLWGWGQTRGVRGLSTSKMYSHQRTTFPYHCFPYRFSLLFFLIIFPYSFSLSFFHIIFLLSFFIIITDFLILFYPSFLSKAFAYSMIHSIQFGFVFQQISTKLELKSGKLWLLVI